MSRRDERIDNDPQVQAAARTLGIRAKAGLREAIVRAAEAKVVSWIDDLGEELAELDDLQRLILNRSGVRIVRINEDGDIAAVEKTYNRRVLPVQLELEFSQDTEALVFKNPSSDARSAAQLIAVVDARGDRRARAWFAERHEPSHVLCGDRGLGTVAFRRTITDRPEPIEQVVDAVAAVVGFWAPIVRPVLARELAKGDVLDAFDRTRAALAPDASIEASYRAFTRLCAHPLVLLRCDYAARRGDDDGRSIALRAKTVIFNAAADDAGVRVPVNYRVPSDSIIALAHSSGAAMHGDDDLRRWKDSKGRALDACKVRISTRGSWAALTPV